MDELQLLEHEPITFGVDRQDANNIMDSVLQKVEAQSADMSPEERFNCLSETEQEQFGHYAVTHYMELTDSQMETFRYALNSTRLNQDNVMQVAELLHMAQIEKNFHLKSPDLIAVKKYLENTHQYFDHEIDKSDRETVANSLLQTALLAQNQGDWHFAEDMALLAIPWATDTDAKCQDILATVCKSIDDKRFDCHGADFTYFEKQHRELFPKTAEAVREEVLELMQNSPYARINVVDTLEQYLDHPEIMQFVDALVTKTNSAGFFLDLPQESTIVKTDWYHEKKQVAENTLSEFSHSLGLQDHMLYRSSLIELAKLNNDEWHSSQFEDIPLQALVPNEDGRFEWVEPAYRRDGDSKFKFAYQGLVVFREKPEFDGAIPLEHEEIPEIIRRNIVADAASETNIYMGCEVHFLPFDQKKLAEPGNVRETYTIMRMAAAGLQEFLKFCDEQHIAGSMALSGVTNPRMANFLIHAGFSCANFDNEEVERLAKADDNKHQVELFADVDALRFAANTPLLKRLLRDTRK